METAKQIRIFWIEWFSFSFWLEISDFGWTEAHHVLFHEARNKKGRRLMSCENVLNPHFGGSTGTTIKHNPQLRLRAGPTLHYTSNNPCSKQFQRICHQKCRKITCSNGKTKKFERQTSLWFCKVANFPKQKEFLIKILFCFRYFMSIGDEQKSWRPC